MYGCVYAHVICRYAQACMHACWQAGHTSLHPYMHAYLSVYEKLYICARRARLLVTYTCIGTVLKT